MTSPKAPRPPAGLALAGRTVWKTLTTEYVFDTREILLLAVVCKQADQVAALEEQVAEDGLMVTGAAGQLRFSPIPGELRQSRLALSRLISDLAIPSSDGAAVISPRKRRARHAADTRWNRLAADQARRAGQVS